MLVRPNENSCLAMSSWLQDLHSFQHTSFSKSLKLILKSKNQIEQQICTLINHKILQSHEGVKLYTEDGYPVDDVFPMK